MKITIKKEYTTLAQLPKVKEDIKEFKEAFTDRDLLCSFIDATETDIWCADVISVNIEAFPGGSLYNDETHFSVNILCKQWKEYIEIHFYCDTGLSVNTGDLLDYRGISTGQKMYSCNRYILSET